MNNLYIHPFFLLRTPVLPAVAPTTELIATGLRSEVIKMAFFLASTSLWDDLEKANWNWDEANPKLKLTVQKYWNRMSFRPTPFGLFATHYKGFWQQRNDEQLPVNNLTDNELLLLPDFRWLSMLSSAIPLDGIEKLRYYLNDTIYTAGSDFRFYFKANLPVNEPVEVLSVDRTAFMKKLFSFFKNSRTLAEIVTFLSQYTDTPSELLDSMLEQQLLFTELRPNIAGSFFGDRLLEYPDGRQLLKLLPDMVYQPVSEISADGISQILKENFHTNLFKHAYYAITRSPKTITTSTKLQEPLLAALEVLNKLNLPPEITGLEAFLMAFEKRYEQQEIPLLTALDPEYGIGYQSLTTQDNNPQILEGLDFQQAAHFSHLKWTPINQLLVNKIAEKSYIIDLSEKDVSQLPESKMSLPPGLQVVFQKTGDQIIVQEAGGVNGIYLFARFTVQQPEIAEQCSEIARQEQLTNPDVVFADVTFIPDEHAANVSVRDSFYDFEIPVLNNSVRKKDEIIKLNDLYVRVHENEILLISKRLNRRVIPRFNSAYNFSRSNNPIIRFLGDLQFQGVLATLTFNFSKVLPGLKFYPRVAYQGTILSAATWHLNDDDTSRFQLTKSTIQSHLENLGVPRYFVVSEHDHQLVFDQQNELDIALFANICNGKKHVVLKEFFHPNDHKDVVNPSGDAVVNQFVCTVVNNLKTYDAPPALFSLDDRNGLQRSFKPGDKWCYIKLFGHVRSLNDFLTFGLNPVLKKLHKKLNVNSWFFIRYNIPQDHLRIRILTDQTDTVLQEFNAALRRKQFSGRFPRLSIDTYDEERERYISIEDAEEVFKLSSTLIVKYFEVQNSINKAIPELPFAVFCCLIYLDGLQLEEQHQVNYLESLANYYLTESGSDKNTKRQLDLKFRAERSQIERFLNFGIGILMTEVNLLKNAVANYFADLKDLKTQKPLSHICSDLLHMHFNRLFSDEQRRKEGVVYYVAAKYLASEFARKKNMIKHDRN